MFLVTTLNDGISRSILQKLPKLATVNLLSIPGLSDETGVHRLTQPQSQHLEDSGQSLSCEHDCSVISAGHLFGSDTNGHTPGRTKSGWQIEISHKHVLNHREDFSKIEKSHLVNYNKR